MARKHSELFEGDKMGKKGKKAAKAAVAATEAERMKKFCSNCGKVGSGEKNLSKCAFCELARYCSRDR